MIALVEERQARLGIAPLCDALGLARATFYRRRGGPPPGPPAPRDRRPPRQALTPAERAEVLALLHEERFVDRPPAQVWAQVLDAGQVPPCSIRTMYRVLAANAEVRERRNQLRHPAYRKPELLATGVSPRENWYLPSSVTSCGRSLAPRSDADPSRTKQHQGSGRSHRGLRPRRAPRWLSQPGKTELRWHTHA